MRYLQRGAIFLLSLTIGWSGWKGLNALLLDGPRPFPVQTQGDQAMPLKVRKSDAEWKKTLPPEQYKVMFQCSTEAPFSGKYNDFWEKGRYECAACGAVLFASEAKYEHGTGWPSFKAPSTEGSLTYREDRSLGLTRTEVLCASCGAHLGHVFEDGPAPTNLHYCINSAAMAFRPAADEAQANSEVATFAAGCFWGVEYKLARLDGVLSTAVGYTGGTLRQPTYKKVCRDDTGHAEAVQVTFDPARLPYEDLVLKFFALHDPTQVNRQGPDVGSQYRSAIFFHSEAQRAAAERIKTELEKEGRFRGRIATEIAPAGEFWRAEEYHQKYYEKNKRGACAF